jgi:hypothetical protein
MSYTLKDLISLMSRTRCGERLICVCFFVLFCSVFFFFFFFFFFTFIYIYYYFIYYYFIYIYILILVVFWPSFCFFSNTHVIFDLFTKWSVWTRCSMGQLGF